MNKLKVAIKIISVILCIECLIKSLRARLKGSFKDEIGYKLHAIIYLIISLA